MSSRTVDQVDEWEPVSFGGGYGGLRALADREFSGAVVAGPARLFMLNGTVVGVLGGGIEQFEDADGTAREAPHDALPLLAVMQEQGQEPQGQYYTEDTSISEVDATLSDGNFTGYVELSENVLSGDYYVVYHQGRSMSAAWVGTSQRLVTGDEAFEQADDEVGIYEVYPADIEPIEIPGSATEPTSSGGAASGGDTPPSDGARQHSDTAPSERTNDTPSGTTTDAPPEPDRESSPRPDTEPADPASDRSPEEWARSSDEERTEPTTATSDPSAERRQRDTATGGPPGSKSVGGRERAPTETPSEQPDTEPTGAEEQTTADGTSGRDRQPTDDGSNRGDEQATEGGPTAGDERSAEGGSGARPDPDTEADTAGESRTAPSERARDPADTGESTEPASDRQPTAAEEQPSPTGSSRTDDPDPVSLGGDRQQSGSTESSSDADAAIPDFETRSIPSLDPERSTQLTEGQSGDTGGGGGDEYGTTERSPSEAPTAQSDTTDPQTTDRSESARTARRREQEPSSQPARTEPAAGDSPPGSEDATSHRADDPAASTEQARSTPSQGGGSDERVRELRSKLDDRTAEVDRLSTELADLEEQNRTLRDENAELGDERERLETQLREANQEIARLEDRVASLREQLPDQVTGTDPSQRLSPEEALGGTNLFVRYNSKSDATLADARDGSADPEDVDANLRIQYHTQFEAESATVDGQPFHDFLTGCLPYRFVSWLVTKLLYEIRDTGHAAEMEVLYDALPEIDRIELNGQVSLTYIEDGDEHREQERYDVVVRDRMGNPLIVANINDRKEPATEDQMTDLLTTTERLGNTSSSLAAAFLVTESFFAPEALETAEEATAGGLFSRNKRASFVNLSRSDGYHLCLLEAREGEFNMAVPEL